MANSARCPIGNQPSGGNPMTVRPAAGRGSGGWACQSSGRRSRNMNLPPLSLMSRVPLVGVVSHKLAWVVVVALAIATDGCHKQTTASETPTSQQAQTQRGATPSPGQQEQPGVATTSSQPLAGEVHPFMTAQLRIFIQQKGRLPADFAELARTRLDVVPRTPTGMTWAIDRNTQEVKLVKNSGAFSGGFSGNVVHCAYWLCHVRNRC
jgi:hypothetical protein